MINQNVSIVIPTFNRIEYLLETIKSCENQTTKCEIIVVDHGSSDGTKDYFKNNKFSKIKYIRKEKDNGEYFACIDGILNSSHEIVHLQFDDDLIHPTFIEKTLKYLSDSDVGLVFTSVQLIDKFGHLKKTTIQKNIFQTGVHSSIKLEKYIFKNNMISPGSILLRKKDIIDSIYLGKLPLEKYSYRGVGPDLNVSLLCCLRYKNFAYINEDLALFREHDKSITTQANQLNSDQYLFIKSYDEVRKFYLSTKLQTNLIFKIYFFIRLLSFRNLYYFLYKINNSKFRNLLNTIKKKYKKKI